MAHSNENNWEFLTVTIEIETLNQGDLLQWSALFWVIDKRISIKMKQLCSCRLAWLFYV